MARNSNKYGGANPKQGGVMASPILVFSLVLVSWLGAFYHTRTELGLGPLRPENSLPALVGVGMFLSWWRSANSRRLWTWLLLAWTAGAHLFVGALLSVLPLAVLPFSPEQSIGHYSSHLVYGLAQMPLIIVLVRSLSVGNASVPHAAMDG
ncbi:MAG: hypothetical protein WBR18_14540 [Anaerolineales bacterium]